MFYTLRALSSSLKIRIVELFTENMNVRNGVSNSATIQPLFSAVQDHQHVLVQREMENGHSPLVSIPPFGRGSSRHWVYRSDVVFWEREAGLRAPVIVSMIPPGYPSAWLHHAVKYQTDGLDKQARNRRQIGDASGTLRAA